MNFRTKDSSNAKWFIYTRFSPSILLSYLIIFYIFFHLGLNKKLRTTILIMGNMKTKTGDIDRYTAPLELNPFLFICFVGGGATLTPCYGVERYHYGEYLCRQITHIQLLKKDRHTFFLTILPLRFLHFYFENPVWPFHYLVLGYIPN